MNHQLCIEVEHPEVIPILHSHRVVDLQYVLTKGVVFWYRHARQCSYGRIHIVDEIRHGLVSEIILKCSACDKTLKLSTEDSNHHVSLINTEYVWRTLTSGSTFHQTKEIFSTLNIPTMSYTMFSNIQNDLSKEWEQAMLDPLRKLQ